MNLKSRFFLVLVALMASFALAACGGEGSNGGGEPSANQTVASDAVNLAYQQTAISVPAGQPATVTFQNAAQGLQHNWVLVRGGEEVAAQVDEAATTAGAPDYLPAGDPNVIAATKMLDAGGSEAVTFTVEAGTYTYLCTFPGHYTAGMHGTLTAQ